MSIVGIIAAVSAVSITLGSGIIVYGVYLLVSSVRSEEVHNVKKVEAKAKAEVKVLHQSEETAKRLQHRDLRALAAVRLELRVLKDIERDYTQWLTLLQVSEKQKCLTSKETKEFQKQYRAIIKNIHVLTGRALRREKRAERGVISLDRKLITELKHVTNDHEAFLKASVKLRQSPGTTHSELGLLLKKLEQEQLDPKVTNEVKSELAYWIKLIEFRQKLVLRLQIIEKNFGECKLPLGQTGNDVKLSTALQNLRSLIGGKKPFDHKIHDTTVGDIVLKIKVVIQKNPIKPIVDDYHKLEGEIGVLVHNEGEQEKKIEEEAKVEEEDEKKVVASAEKNLRALHNFSLQYNDKKSIYNQMFVNYTDFLTSNKHIFQCTTSYLPRELFVTDAKDTALFMREFGLSDSKVKAILNTMKPRLIAGLKGLKRNDVQLIPTDNLSGHLQINITPIDGKGHEKPRSNMYGHTFENSPKLYYRIGYNFDVTKDITSQLNQFVNDYIDGVIAATKVLVDVVGHDKIHLATKFWCDDSIVFDGNPDAYIAYTYTSEHAGLEKKLTRAFYHGNMFDPKIQRHRSGFDPKKYRFKNKKVIHRKCDAKHYVYAYNSHHANSYSFIEGSLFSSILFLELYKEAGDAFLKFILHKKKMDDLPSNLMQGFQKSLNSTIKRMKGYEYPNGANATARKKYFESMITLMDKIDLEAQAVRSKISKKAA